MQSGLAAELLSVVNTAICFRMTLPEDLRRFAEYLYAQNMEFAELFHEVERRAGHEWLEVNDWSETTSRQTGIARSSASTMTSGETLQQSEGRGQKLERSASYDADNQPAGATHSGGTIANHTTARGRQQSFSDQSATTDSSSTGHAITVNHKLVHLEKIVRKFQKTGQLEQAVADQVSRFAQRINGHDQRHATVRVGSGKAFHMETAAVPDPFRSEEAQARTVEWIKRELYATHDYYFAPCLDPEQQLRRIDEFMGNGHSNGHPANGDASDSPFPQ